MHKNFSVPISIVIIVNRLIRRGLWLSGAWTS